jgi:tetratricopeptide (TPR) repeat protein
MAPSFHIFPLGAKLALWHAHAALRAGDLGVASAVGRAYLARRLPQVRLPLRKLDAHVAAMVALAALLRGDAEEIKGAAALVDDTGDNDTLAARIAVAWYAAALAGDVKTAVEDASAVSLWSELSPLIVLIAVERGLERVTPELAPLVRDRLDSRVGSVDLRARSAVVLARLALMDRDRAAAIQALSAIPAGAAPLYRSLAAVALGDVPAASAAIAALPAEERPAVVGFAASLAVGAGSATARSVLDAFGAHVSATTRAGLAATLAVALAREGKADDARRVLDAERARDAASPLLAASAAYVALHRGDAEQATAALENTPRTEAAIVALSLAALALAGDHAALVGEARQLSIPMPDRYASALRPLVLAALARGDAPLGDTLPEWLRAPPDEAPGVYAWGLIRLVQGNADDATVALDAALESEPELAALGDAPEIARLTIARGRFLAGEIDRVSALARDIKSPRLLPVAARLTALGLIKRRAAREELELDAENLPPFVEKLHAEHGPETPERAGLALVRADLGLLHARNLLCAGKVTEARAALEPLRADGGAPVAFLAAVADLLDGRRTRDEVEATLTQAAQAHPTDAALQVLLAEIGLATRGRDAVITALEAALARAQSPLLQQALASAYHGGHRGLDVKRIGFSAMTQSRGRARDELAAELASVLAFEAPPPAARADDRLERAPARDALPAPGLSARVHVLFAHAATACEREPGIWAAIEPAVQRLKRSLMTDDLPEGLAAEKEIVRLMGRSGR